MTEQQAQQNTQIAPPSTEENATEIDLLELFYRLLEKAKYIVAASLLGALLMGIYSFFIATPVYEATSKLYVLSSSDSAINLSDLQIGSYLTADYQEVFNTWEIHENVLQNLKLNYTYEQLRKMLTISNPSNTRMLYITVSSTDPQEAANMANEYASVAQHYISDTMKTDKPSEMSRALVPIQPVSPKKAQNVIIGFVVGFLLSAGVVTLLFVQDDKIKTMEDIRKYTGMSTLALVPVNGADKKAKSGMGGRRKEKDA